VTAWAKLTMNTRFALEYISHAGALRYYYADFVLRLDDDTCLVIETKGQEDLDVALKDRRARRWCRDATRLAGREWAYEKVPQKLFDGFQGDTMDELRPAPRCQRRRIWTGARGRRRHRLALESTWLRTSCAR